MRKMSSLEIRQTWLRFFQSKGQGLRTGHQFRGQQGQL